jgi:peptidoglycan/xylan/chitin deacetylase (PgdA/CDA1 family)
MDSVARELFLSDVEHVFGIAPPRADSRPMSSWEDLRALQYEGHEIGSHTLSHASLRYCSPGERRRQIWESRAATERELGRPIRLFSYPFGRADAWDATVVLEARAAGFDYAFTTIPEMLTRATNRWAIPRISVSRDDGFEGFLLKRLLPAGSKLLVPRAGWRQR